MGFATLNPSYDLAQAYAAFPRYCLCTLPFCTQGYGAFSAPAFRPPRTFEELELEGWEYGRTRRRPKNTGGGALASRFRGLRRLSGGQEGVDARHTAGA
jgi:hypothetical protein